MNLFDRLRYMTFNATIFTSFSSLAAGLMGIWEVTRDKEVTYRFLYFLKLSTAVTEFVVFAVVMVGLLPILKDRPDVTSYTGVMMYLVIPPLAMLSFILNQAPLGRMTPWHIFQGTWFITIYAGAMLFLFGTSILSPSRAPYSFLDFENSRLAFILTTVVGIYLVGYGISALLIKLNKLGYWLWYKDLV